VGRRCACPCIGVLSPCLSAGFLLAPGPALAETSRGGKTSTAPPSISWGKPAPRTSAQLYEQAVEEGPDFINYRSKSAFEAAPRLGIDRNTYARILSALDMIERGTYRNCREKGKQGIPRTVARVLNGPLPPPATR
jgi:hypothetical protein